MANLEPARILIKECAAQPDCAVAPPEDLAAHAEREVARLEHHRRLAARSHSDPKPVAGRRTVASAAGRRTRVPPGLYLVFALILAGVDGSRVHAEALAVRGEFHLDCRGRLAKGRMAARLRGIVSAVTQSRERFLHTLVREGANDPREAVTRLAALCRERLRQRERSIADVFAPGQPSAARLLVQAGLFDRRSLAAAAAHATSETARREEMNERALSLTDDLPLDTRVELIAALLVPDRR
jgi:hypothetical protein